MLETLTIKQDFANEIIHSFDVNTETVDSSEIVFKKGEKFEVDIISVQDDIIQIQFCNGDVADLVKNNDLFKLK